MNKIKRSMRLLQASFGVLRREKKLFLFPFIGSMLAIVALLFFVTPILLYPTGHPYASAAHLSTLATKLGYDSSPSNGAHHAPAAVGIYAMPAAAAPFMTQWWAGPFMGLVYLASMFLATFSNVAFYHEIMQALNGNPVSMRRGLRFALARWRAVLLWSLFAGLVGYVIRSIQERLGFLGQLVTSLIGVVWSVACIFIIPTLVRDTETSDPIKLLRNSAGTLKRTWGEMVIGFYGLEMAFGAFFFLVTAVMVGGGICIYKLGLHSHGQILWLILLGVGGLFGVAMLLSWLSGVVNPVYRCALYIYATEGVIPETFDQELLDSAWKVK